MTHIFYIQNEFTKKRERKDKEGIYRDKAKDIKY